MPRSPSFSLFAFLAVSVVVLQISTVEAGKVKFVVQGALKGVQKYGPELKEYGVSTAQAEKVLKSVVARFGEVEVNAARVMMPYFEGAAKSVGLRPEVGIHVYNALYFTFGI